MRDINKQSVKKLAQAVGKVLSANEYANEMNALIDYGEWSHSDPDFSGLVKEWGLDREQLLACCDLAKEQMMLFDRNYPVDNFKRNFEKGIFYPKDLNPWHHVHMSLHCIFMAGELQKEEADMTLNV